MFDETAHSSEAEPNVPKPEEDIGGPASRGELEELAKKGIGSKVSEEAERQPESVSLDTPEESGSAADHDVEAQGPQNKAPGTIEEGPPEAVSAQELPTSTDEPIAQPPSAEEKPAEPEPSAEKAEKTIDELVQERVDALGPRKSLKDLAKGKSYRIRSIDEEEVKGGVLKKFHVKLPDGRVHWFSEKTVRDILRDNIKAEQKEAAEAAEEVEKAEKNASKEAADTKRTEQKERYEAGKTRLSKGLDESVGGQREFLRAGHDIGYELRRGKERLTFEKFDPEVSNPFVFRDPNGNRQYLHENDVDRLIKRRFEKENKEIVEELKPESRAKEITGEGLETAGKGAKALIETAEKNPVGRFLLRQGEAFLDKFRISDKDKIPYFVGMGLGFGSNVALTAFTPFLAFGPGRFVRSAAYSGVLLGVSKGVNLVRDFAIREIGKELGSFDKEFTKGAVNTFNHSAQLEAEGKLEESINVRNEWSKETFLKSDYKERSDYWALTQDKARAALIAKVEQQMSKFNKLSHGVKSFSAGLSAGTITASVGFGFFDGIFKPLIDRISSGDLKPPGWVPFIGHSAPGIPEHTPTPGVPEHAPSPGIPEHTPTPEVPEHTPTPGVPEHPTGTEIPTHPPETTAGAAVPTEVHTFPEIPTNTVEIEQGTTAGHIFVQQGHELTWDSKNAVLFGETIKDEANHDMLVQMGNNVPALEDLPGLEQAAAAGNPEALRTLTEALHNIPAGGTLNVPTPEGVETAKRALGITG